MLEAGDVCDNDMQGVRAELLALFDAAVGSVAKRKVEMLC